MVRDEGKYEEAVLFRKRGFTYAEIARLCGVSKATVSSWLAHEPFSQRVRDENAKRAARENQKRIALVNKARRAERAASYREAVRAAETEYKHYRSAPRFAAALGVYIASGDQAPDTPIRLSTNREAAQRLFVAFARDYLGAEASDIRCWLLLQEGHDEVACLKRWARVVRLPVSRFGRAQYVGATPSSPPLHFGTLNTIIGSTVLKRKLLRWIELASKER